MRFLTPCVCTDHYPLSFLFRDVSLFAQSQEKHVACSISKAKQVQPSYAKRTTSIFQQPSRSVLCVLVEYFLNVPVRCVFQVCRISNIKKRKSCPCMNDPLLLRCVALVLSLFCSDLWSKRTYASPPPQSCPPCSGHTLHTDPCYRSCPPTADAVV